MVRDDPPEEGRGWAGHHATTRADPSPVAGATSGPCSGVPRADRRLAHVTGPGVDAPPPAIQPTPIRWGLGRFAVALPATILGQIVIGTFVVAARGAPPHYRSGAVDIAWITAGSAVVTLVLLRAFVATRGRGSLRADLGLTVRVTDWP